MYKCNHKGRHLYNLYINEMLISKSSTNAELMAPYLLYVLTVHPFLAHCCFPPTVLPNHPLACFLGKHQHQNKSNDQSATMNVTLPFFGKGQEGKADL